jgi:hypothetical protein
MFKGVLVVIALLAALFVVSGCGDSSSGDSGGSAHINEESGSTHDLLPDERVGTPPPAPKETDLKKVAEKANCFLFLNTQPKKGKPLPQGAAPPEYETYPPASGDYVETPYQQADGAYLNMVENIDQLGAVNHGRLAIQYAPDLPEGMQLKLKGLYDTMYGATLLFPNDEMEYAVAATAWTKFLGCTAFEGQKTLDAVRAFGKATWGRYGSEPVKSFPFEGPTPADPEEPQSGN